MHTSPTDEDGLLNAGLAAGMSRCARRSVGAASYDAAGRLVRTGANGVPTQEQIACENGGCPRGTLTLEECPSYEDGPTEYKTGPTRCIFPHAEVAAGHVEGGTLYVTNKPCNDCWNYIENQTKLARVVWPNGLWVRGYTE